MGMMIIRHKVRDYGQWRPIFDGHVEMQRAVGLINPRVYHSADSNTRHEKRTRPRTAATTHEVKTTALPWPKAGRASFAGH